jgi:hypothetical protein
LATKGRGGGDRTGDSVYRACSGGACGRE